MAYVSEYVNPRVLSFLGKKHYRKVLFVVLFCSLSVGHSFENEVKAVGLEKAIGLVNRDLKVASTVMRKKETGHLFPSMHNSQQVLIFTINR